MTAEMREERRFARAWLFDAALPLWWRAGADRVHGGWVDRVDAQGVAVSGPKRCRVQARQVFVYAEAGRLGWDGPWIDAVEHGLAFLLERFRRADGLFRASVTAQGAPLDDAFDLYDQAFVLLALASAYARLDRPVVLLREAEALLALLDNRLAHPDGGWHEDLTPRVPLRSNPHMHLLEALLAWVEAGGGEVFASRARVIVALALDRLIDPETGAVSEYFDADWRAMPGDIGTVREPGHQFEWAYLLGEAARLLGGDHAQAIARLYDFGDRYGVDARGVVIFSTDARGAPLDQGARLWAQTERLRTAVTLGHADDAAAAFACVRRFLDRPVAGLWLDKTTPDGAFVDEAAPASSLYHLVTGLAPLLERGCALEEAA